MVSNYTLICSFQASLEKRERFSKLTVGVVGAQIDEYEEEVVVTTGGPVRSTVVAATVAAPTIPPPQRAFVSDL